MPQESLVNSDSPHHRTRIKICGVRHPEDAVYAVRAGADAIGIVCYPQATRYVPPEEARLIFRALPPLVTSVALFVDQTPGDIAAVVAAIGAACVQLHGHESPDLVRQVHTPVLKAVRVDRATFESELDDWRKEIARGGLEHLQGLVLETAGRGIGGTGVANDWTFVRQVAAKHGFEGLPPLIAAGGLTAETVGDVIRFIHPWAVDVSSGVEVVKARKSPELIKAFITAVRVSQP